MVDVVVVLGLHRSVTHVYASHIFRRQSSRQEYTGFFSFTDRTSCSTMREKRERLTSEHIRTHDAIGAESLRLGCNWRHWWSARRWWDSFPCQVQLLPAVQPCPAMSSHFGHPKILVLTVCCPDRPRKQQPQRGLMVRRSNTSSMMV